MILDVPRHRAPKAGVKHWVAALAMRLGGWSPGDDPPELAKYITIGAPHTSWWDGIWLVVFAWWWGIPARWLVKNTIAPRGARWLFQLAGGVLVNRSSPHGLVKDLAEEFRQRDQLILMLAPEGTRRKREYWKTGFYFIALEANVPICLAKLDYRARKASFGPCFVPSGNVRADMELVREYYREMHPRYEGQFTPPRLREEAAG